MTAARRAEGYWSDPVAWAHDCIDWPDGEFLADYQQEILTALHEERRVAVRGPHGLGKDLAVSTPIPTPTGWTTMGGLSVGDTIFDDQGEPCRVTYAEEPQWRDAYHVRFSDGASVTAGAGHLWTAVNIGRRPKGVSDWRDRWDVADTVETRHIASTLRTRSGQYQWRVPTARPVACPEAVLPVPPYTLGIWLGDGNTLSPLVTLNRDDAATIVAAIVAEGIGTHEVPSGDKPSCIQVRLERQTGVFRDAGFLGHKHIPDVYLRASVAQRRELVRGLFDSDGYRQAGGSDEITLTNKTLAADTAELLRSLGFAVRVSESDAKLNGRFISRRWRIAARFDFNPYKLARYDWTPRAAQASRHTQRTITAANPVGVALTRCIAVDSPSRLFLAGEGFIPTHNTCLGSIGVLHFAVTREYAGVDWKVPTTASVGRQLTQYFWPEIRKWARRLRWDVIGVDEWRRGKEMLEQHIKLMFGEAFALTSDDPSSIEGAHATELLYLFDEAKAISDGVFDAAEGAFSTAGKEKGTNAYALAISTPGEPIGRFYDIHARKPGTEQWWVRHVTVEEAERAGRVTAEWVEQQYLLWGDSAIFANRVLGEFMSSSEDTVIPLAWVELANDRWRARFERIDAETGRRVLGRPRDTRDGTPSVIEEGWKLHTLGVDVARGGEDRSVIALRQGNFILELRRYAYSDDTMLLANQVDAIQNAHGAPVAIVDVIGVGAGVYDRQRERSQPCRPFNSSEGTKRTDISGEFGFVNKRSHAWWNLREMLDPVSGCDVALPPDDRLTGDLVAPKWKLMAGGRIQVESKDDIKKRIHRSTDDGDACLARGTLITTSAGDIPIEDVAVGDMVWTRGGWRPVTWSGCTNLSARLVGVELADGRRLVGTGSHPVWDGEDFSRLDAFGYADRMWVCEPNESSSTESSSPATQTRRAGSTGSTSGRLRPSGRKASGRFIRRSGRLLTVRSRQGTSSITSTKSPSTTTRRTWPLSRQASTLVFMSWRTRRRGATTPTWTGCGNGPANGTGLKLAERGTKSTAAGHGRAEPQTAPWSALAAGGKSRRSTPGREATAGVTARPLATSGYSEPNDATQSGRAPYVETPFGPLADSRLAPVRVARIYDAGVGPVYNLTVKDQPEYLADGILVHNCVYALIESGGSWADLYKPQVEEPDDGVPVPQPRQPLRRGWGDVYKTDEQLAAEQSDTPIPTPPPGMGQMPSRQGGWFGPNR